MGLHEYAGYLPFIMLSAGPPFFAQPAVAAQKNWRAGARKSLFWLVLSFGLAADLALSVWVWQNVVAGPVERVAATASVGVTGIGLNVWSFLASMATLPGKTKPSAWSSRYQRDTASGRGAKKVKPCRDGSQPQLMELAPFAGTCQSAAVAFRGFRTYVCPTDQQHHEWPDPEFGSKLVDELCEGRVIPVTQESGFFRKRQYCSGCNSPIGTAKTGYAKLEGQAVLEGVSPFTFRYEGPVVTCPSCGRVQMLGDGGSCNSLLNATADAMGSIDLKP